MLRQSTPNPPAPAPAPFGECFPPRARPVCSTCDTIAMSSVAKATHLRHFITRARRLGVRYESSYGGSTSTPLASRFTLPEP